MTTRQATNGSSKRVVFIDQARALAISLMLFGHSMDQFLAEPWRSSAFWTNYQFFRGVSSAMFLFISGFSFIVASFKYFDDYTRFSPRLFGRIRRIAMVLFLGILLQLYAPTLSQSINTVTNSNLEKLFKFDVLQNIAAGLILLHGIVWLTKKKKTFFMSVIVCSITVFVIGALTYRPSVDARLPIWGSAALNLYHQSRFPLIPFTGYLLTGSTVGFLYLSFKKAQREKVLFKLVPLLSLALIGFDLAIRDNPVFFPYSMGAKGLPGYAFARLGSATLFISGLFWIEQKKQYIRRLSFLLSSESLTIYFVHLFLVYGTQTVPGFFPSMAKGMNPGQISIWILSLFGAMILMAYFLNKARKTYPIIVQMTRHWFVSSIIVSFLLLDKLALSRTIPIVISCAIAVILLHTLYRHRHTLKEFLPPS